MSDSDPGFNPQNYQTSQYQFNNQGFNSASALQIRLDTDTVKENLAPYFRGVDVRTVMDEEGNARQVVLWQGEALCNDMGYQAIRRWMEICMNSQVIQGNMEDREIFSMHMQNIHRDITDEFIIKRKKYGIGIDNVAGIIHSLVNLAYPIMTRTLFDRERQLMGNTVKVQETMQTQPPRGIFNSIPGFGGRR